MADEEPFYIGYLSRAPVATAAFVRRVVGVLGVFLLVGAGVLAVMLPYFGMGEFEYGRPRDFRGTIRCEGGVPRLSSGNGDLLLVGFGKHRAPPEICGARDAEVTVRGTLIHREGRQLVEFERFVGAREPARMSEPPVRLGRFTLRGEIVDSKCYFGVMNPGEGRVHRACAELCLRGGVPAVLVTRDRAGNVAHLLVAAREGGSAGRDVLPWVGQPVEVSGEVIRRGRWLEIVPESPPKAAD